MSSGRIPTGSEVLDVLVRLERDPEQRIKLASSYEIFRVCVAAELVGEDSIDWLAQVMQQLYGEKLIAHGAVNGGVREPPVWDGTWLQQIHGWRVTASGRADAALFQQGTSGTPASANADAPSHDVFICHAGEDKETVALPLCTALKSRGWSVWLDDLELTIGDSLSGSIEAALARSRFGVVILSPAFFKKTWPRRELSGIAAREVNAERKVILPVWHNVDQHYLAERAPILADRLGASTSLGIEEVADQLSRALERAGLQAEQGTEPRPIVQPIVPSPSDGRLTIPSTPDEQARVADDRPPHWEYLLFAGFLVQGRRELEPKWDDHELRLPRGPKQDFDRATTLGYLTREMGWVQTQLEVLTRILSPEAVEAAFGAPGEPGDPEKIAGLARRLLSMYEALMDWAANLRNTSVPDDFRELREATACFVDQAINAIRHFVDEVADTTARLPELAAQATDDEPARIVMRLTLKVDPAVEQRYMTALQRLKANLRG